MSLSYFLLKILKKIGVGRIIFKILSKIINISNNLPTSKASKYILFKKRHHNYKNKLIIHKSFNLSQIYDLQIIVPVYNSAKYIRTCLNSIINQDTSYTFQIIIINDGSIDNTKNILNSYKTNSHVRVINQQNMGRSSARNTGLKHVNSKYIMFVDSDDKLAYNAVQNLLNYAYKFKSDIVCGSYYSTKDNGKIKHQHVFSNCEYIHLKSYEDINGYLWGKVFKSSLFKDIYFPVGYEFEDTILAFWIYPKCRKISSINNVVYYYQSNPKSISNNFQKHSLSIDSFLITVLLIKELSQLNISKDLRMYNTFLKQIKMNGVRNINKNVYIKKSIFVLTVRIYQKYFSNFITNVNYLRPLEDSIRTVNYNEYILFCILM